MASAVAVVLLVLYTLLFAYVAWQIALLLAQKHKPLSYKAVFNWFALAWLFLRALFWGLSVSDTLVNLPDSQQFWFYLMYWLPHSILYMTFATLALFLTKVIWRRQWTGRFRNRLLLLYSVFGTLDVIGTITLSAEAGKSDALSVVADHIESGGHAILFLLLCGVYMCVARLRGPPVAISRHHRPHFSSHSAFACIPRPRHHARSWLGLRLSALTAWEYNRMFMFQPRTISRVAFLLAAVFGSRCIWNWLTFARVISVEIGCVTWLVDGGYPRMPPSARPRSCAARPPRVQPHSRTRPRPQRRRDARQRCHHHLRVSAVGVLPPRTAAQHHCDEYVVTAACGSCAALCAGGSTRALSSLPCHCRPSRHRAECGGGGDAAFRRVRCHRRDGSGGPRRGQGRSPAHDGGSRRRQPSWGHSYGHGLPQR